MRWIGVKEKMIKKVATLIISILIASLAMARPAQSLSEIRALINKEMLTKLKRHNPQAELSIDVSAIDSRLRLARCGKGNLEIEQNSSRIEQTTTVSVKCHGPVYWSFYVPIRLKVLKDVVISRHHIAKGHMITEQDLKTVKLNTRKLTHGYYKDSAPIIGKLAKRSMQKNHIIAPNNLMFAKLIKKGELVKITAKNDQVQVSVKGIALQSGAAGQIIAVKNMTSKKVIEGKVVGRKAVLINI